MGGTPGGWLPPALIAGYARFLAVIDTCSPIETAAAILSGAAPCFGAPADGRPTESTDESWQQRLLRLTGFDATLCPHCRRGRLQPVQSLPARRRYVDPRGPP